jgi:hypothetical protein
LDFDRACDLVEAGLAGDERRRVVAELCTRHRPSRALQRTADALRTNLRDLDARYAALDGVIGQLDARTRRDGFHVLHDWDGRAGRVNPETIPVDVASFAIERRGDEPGHEIAAAILIDYHYLTVLALMSLRVWDAGDPDANLDRLDALLDALHAHGSGHRFASRAATLLLIATAHYEPNEDGYDALLEKIRGLERRHRLVVAIDHAVALGCHLRFGFEASYGRDVGAMRADNAADYPWLHFSVNTLLDAYEGDEMVAEALVNGLCPDPSSLLASGDFAARFRAHRAELLEIFERFRPGERAYSPLGLFFNFSHNVVKGLVVDAVLRARPWPVGLNDLFTSLAPEGEPRAGEGSGSIPRQAATTLMEYARRSPDPIRGRPTPAIVYDPATGRQLFGAAMRRLRDVAGS